MNNLTIIVDTEKAQIKREYSHESQWLPIDILNTQYIEILEELRKAEKEQEELMSEVENDNS